MLKELHYSYYFSYAIVHNAYKALHILQHAWWYFFEQI